MKRELLQHRAGGNECYALDADRLVVMLRTGYDVNAVELCYGDPFSAGIMGGAESWSGDKLKMEPECDLEYQRMWSAVVVPQYKRCKYYFEIHGEDETVYLLEDGCYTKEIMELPGKKQQGFFFSWMNPSDIAVTPDWVGDTVWYQIFPDRFCNGGTGQKPDYIKPWKTGKVSYMDVYGGDIGGIRKKIPYLAELGITGIYHTPVSLTKSNHINNTNDYTKIDPIFGTEEEMCLMIKEAHEAGIRIMLDAVFNHCGTGFAPWRDVWEKGTKSPYYDWFFLNKWPLTKKDYDTRKGSFYSFAFYGQMPKLNTNNPQVVKYLTGLCRHWVNDWQVDGIRFDVGNEVSHSFLKHLRRDLYTVNAYIYLLCELWHDSVEWLKVDEFDSVMNYPFAQSINDFYVDPLMTAEQFSHQINRCYHLYSRQMNRVLFNLLDSHDTERLYTRVGDIGQFYQQLTLLFTMAGSPCIYYGTEIAMEGGFDPDCRRCMPWDEIEKGTYEDRSTMVKRLIALRKEFAAAKDEKIDWNCDSAQPRLVH